MTWASGMGQTARRNPGGRSVRWRCRPVPASTAKRLPDRPTRRPLPFRPPSRGDPVSAIRLPSDQDASGRSFGPEELDALRQVLDSGTLTATKGEFTKRFEAAVADMLGVEHVVACA